MADVAAADVGMAFGDVQSMQADMEWVLANMELLAPATNMDMTPPAYVEMVATWEHPHVDYYFLLILAAPYSRPTTLLFSYSMTESLLGRNQAPSKRNLIVTFF
jgi:hypothetical protein